MRIGLFVDVSHTYKDVKVKWNKKVDYKRLLDYVQRDGKHTVKGFLYGTYPVGTQMENFINTTQFYGYKNMLRQVPQIDRYNHCDVDMVMGIVSKLSRFDCVIIGSSNVAYAKVAKYVREQGKKCYFFVCERTEKMEKFANGVIIINERFFESGYIHRVAN